MDCLNGIWDFAFLGEVDADSLCLSSIVFDDIMAVPGCFDATPRYAGKRGLCAYRKRVRMVRPGHLRLELDGAHHWSRAYCDGRLIGEHAGGFTRFYHDVCCDEAGEVTWLILIDNRFDSAQSPLHREYFDWYQYGGLTRGVSVHTLPGLFIERLETTTESLAPPTLAVRCLYRSDFSRRSALLRILLDDEEVAKRELLLDESSGIIEERLELPGVSLWSPEAPQLHLLTVQLGDDDFTQRVGFRIVETRERQLWINGAALEIRGVNRHDAHPQFGNSVPLQQKISDLQLLKMLGGNFLRGSHYPQDDEFLDLCDELGVCVYDESIGWQHKQEHLLDEVFLSAQKRHIDEMLSASFNHPSVVIWGILNESASNSEDCRVPYSELLTHIKTRDPSRPVTYASCHRFSDCLLDLVDVISVNCYPGWYFGSLDDIPEQLDEIIAYYRAQGVDKPLLISEIGASAIYGCHDYNRQRWTEEYQAELTERVIAHLQRPDTDCIGVCLWQLTDTRTSEQTSTILGKPRGFNNKGLLDEYRRPKSSYFAAQRLFRRGRRSPSSTD